MVLPELGCVFVHIPKTGGQSIELALLEAAGLTWRTRDRALLRINRDPTKGPPRLAHLTAEEYVGLGHVSAVDWRRWTSFAVVRDPWQRLVSAWRYRGHDFPFADFVRARFPRPEDDDYERGVAAFRHVLPQADFVTDRDGAVLVDHILRFERLQEGFDAICGQLGLSPRPLPRRNAAHAGSEDYRAHYDDALAEEVGRRYARDVQLFGYRFA
jgi:hypothetical protein